MKLKYLFWLSLIFINYRAFATGDRVPHILPDASSWEYRKHLKGAFRASTDPSVKEALSIGERNLNWLIFLNSHRTEDQQLKLTKPGQLGGIPIEKWSGYSPKTIRTDLVELNKGIPQELKEVIYGQGEFPKTFSQITDEEYILWAKKVDRIYQTAARWQMMEPYIPFLKDRKYQDLRGYYFLSRKTESLEDVLANYTTMKPEDKAQYQDWLLQLCMNSGKSEALCEIEIKRSIQNSQLFKFYQKYLPSGEAMWNSFFTLENPRSEFIWSKNNIDKMLVPFKVTNDLKINDFLSYNIQDEFKWKTWGLYLDFKPQAAVHVEFQSGVVPHVNGAGGDTITMDKNAPLSEWDVQWTIRHEFGHVLGFVDCYVEFYDSKSQEIINYQLDTSHLMCSRAGTMQESIFETLKKFYLK